MTASASKTRYARRVAALSGRSRMRWRRRRGDADGYKYAFRFKMIFHPEPDGIDRDAQDHRSSP